VALNDKRAAFVREYLIDLNAAAAARRAGYSAKTADRTGYDLLRIPEVAAAVEAGKAERAERASLSAEMVIDGLRSIAQGEASDSARVRAYELLGKHLGMFTDKTEHSGGVAIRVIRE
jgi:phage terminase small subunit